MLDRLYLAAGLLGVTVSAAAAVHFAFFYLPFTWSREPARLVEALAVRAGDRVADIGTGDGSHASRGDDRRRRRRSARDGSRRRAPRASPAPRGRTLPTCGSSKGRPTGTTSPTTAAPRSTCARCSTTSPIPPRSPATSSGASSPAAGSPLSTSRPAVSGSTAATTVSRPKPSRPRSPPPAVRCGCATITGADRRSCCFSSAATSAVQKMRSEDRVEERVPAAASP